LIRCLSIVVSFYETLISGILGQSPLRIKSSVALEGQRGLRPVEVRHGRAWCLSKIEHSPTRSSRNCAVSQQVAVKRRRTGNLLVIRIVGGVPFARGLALWLTHQYALNRT
jgi:hypothetical protein